MTKSLLDGAIKAALQAGHAILPLYHQRENISPALKEDNSPVTRADHLAHRIIEISLMGFDRRIPCISEEGKDIPFPERRAWKSFWLIDPLDGTKEFIKGNGEFTVNIALVQKGKPVLGVIYLPVQGDLYFAEEKKGAFKIDLAAQKQANIISDSYPAASITGLIGSAAPLKAAGNCPQKGSPVRVAVSRSHFDEATGSLIAELEKESGPVELISAGSSLKFCLVAAGEADIYPRLAPTMEWDTAAGHAIAREAGCRVFEHPKGKEPLYNKKEMINPPFIVTAPWIKALTGTSPA